MEDFERALFALASTPEIQNSLYPEFTCKGDELVLEFDDALLSIQIESFPLLAKTALDELNKFLDVHSGPDYEEHYCNNELLFTSDVWKQIRQLANELIESLGWTYNVPAKSGAIYVGG